MKKITHIEGLAIPLNMNEVDTDLIISAQYLTSVSKAGYGEHLFQRLRDNDPEFVFNLPQYKNANILVTQHNFGCGSSREHAVWALMEAGIEAIIAESFADIFANNASKNGLILIEQPIDVITSLLAASTDSACQLSIDLAQDTITHTDKKYTFSINGFHKHCFTQGLDELDYLLAHQADIEQYLQTRTPYD